MPDTKKSIYLGAVATMEKTFTEEDIQQFAKLTGDYGKLHTDAAFAAKYGFGPRHFDRKFTIFDYGHHFARSRNHFNG